MSLLTSRLTVRANIRDNSSTAANQSFSDAQINAKLNDAARLVARKFFPRIARQAFSATGLTINGSTTVGLTTATNYARLIAIQAGTAFNGSQGTRLSVEKFMALTGAQLQDNAPAGVGGVVKWCAWREGSATSASEGKWAVAVYPQPQSNTNYSALVELEQADLAADADTFDLPPEGVTMVENLASFWLAGILERNYAQAFVAQYPELKELGVAKAGYAQAIEG